MHRSRIAILLGTVVAGSALLLPFAAFPARGNVNGITAGGWPAVALLGVPALFALFGDRAEGFGRPTALLAVAAGGAATVFSALKIADAVKAADAAAGSVGAGVWVVAAACVLTLTGCVASLTTRLG